VNCANCGNEFVSENKRKKYCSKRCKEIVAIQKTREKRLKGFDEEKVKWLVSQVNSFNNGMMINKHNTNGFTVGLREKVKGRDNYKCQVCKNVVDLEVHHIIPRINGGVHEIDNLITLCKGCHKAIETGREVKAVQKCFSNYKKVLNYGVVL
jgi:hypothetical protein